VRKCPKGNPLHPRMYCKSGSYYRVSQNKWRKLGRDYYHALREYARLEANTEGWGRLVELAYEEYYRRTKPLAKGTMAQYEGIRARIIHGFSDFEPHEITGRDVTAFLWQYRDTPNIANRSLSVLRHIFDVGMKTGACEHNPAHGVKRLDELKRERVLTDAEYAAIHAKANPVIKVVMDLCYLTGQRIGDILSLRRDQVTDDGILFKQQKTGARLVVQMTPDLAETIAAAKRLRKVASAYLLHPKGKGTPYSYWAIRDAYGRAAAAAGVEDTGLHDLRAKSLTDLKRAGGNPTALAGHRLESTTLRYLRGLDAPVVEGPSLRRSIEIEAKSAK